MNKTTGYLHLFMVIVILAAGLGLRLYRIGDEALWYDEYVNFQFLEMSSAVDHIGAVREIDATFVPAYYLLLYWWTQATSFQVPVARLLSVVISMITGVLLYGLGKRTFGPTAGLIALFILSFSNLHIHYAQEIRVYPLYLMSAVLSMFSLHTHLKNGRRLPLAIHLLANGLLLWTHMFGALVIVTQAVYLLVFCRRPVNRLFLWAGVNAAWGASLLVWIAFINFELLRATTAFIPALRPGDLAHAYAWTHVYLPRSLPGFQKLWMVILVAFILLGVKISRNKEASTDARRGYWLLVLWLTVPTTLLAAATSLGGHSLLLRYALHASLPFCLLVGASVATLPKAPLRLAAIVFIMMLMGVQLAGEERPYRTDYGQMASVIHQHPGHEAASLLLLSVPETVVRHYVRLPDEKVNGFVSQEALLERLKQNVAEAGYAWVFISIPYAPDHEAFITELEALNFSVDQFHVAGAQPAHNATGYWPMLAWVEDVARLYRVYRDAEPPSPEDLAFRQKKSRLTRLP